MRVTLATVLAAALLLPVPRAGARTLTDRHCDNAGCEAVAGVDNTGTGLSGHGRRKPSTRTCQYLPMDLPPTASVVRPDGTTVCNGGGWMTCNLDVTGMYTLLGRDDPGTGVGNYDVTLNCDAPPCGFATIAERYFKLTVPARN